jgi:hypothetical protein
MALAAHTPHHRTAEMQERNALMSKSKMCPKETSSGAMAGKGIN